MHAQPRVSHLQILPATREQNPISEAYREAKDQLRLVYERARKVRVSLDRPSVQKLRSLLPHDMSCISIGHTLVQDHLLTLANYSSRVLRSGARGCMLDKSFMASSGVALAT